MCMCLAWGSVGGECMKGLGLGFTGGVLDECLCFGCGGVGGEWAWTRVWRGGVVCVSCQSGFSA